MDGMDITQFRQDLRSAMDKKGITQKDLSAMMSITQPNISKFLRGLKGISGKDMLLLWPFVYGDDRPQLAQFQPEDGTGDDAKGGQGCAGNTG